MGGAETLPGMIGLRRALEQLPVIGKRCSGAHQAHEPVGVQAFSPKLAVEGLDEGIIRDDACR
jgi:hypothetical protein